MIIVTLIGGVLTFIFVFFPQHIISLIYERGAFTKQDTEIVSESFQYYSYGLIAVLIHTIIIKAYYSLRIEKILFLVTIFSVVVKIILSSILYESLKQNGLALATSLTFIISVTMLLLYIYKYFQLLESRK